MVEAYRRQLQFMPEHMHNEEDHALRYKRQTNATANSNDQWIEIDFRAHTQNGLLFFAASGHNFTMIDVSRRTFVSHLVYLDLQLNNALHESKWRRQARTDSTYRLVAG
jgi:hypothetical protein